MFCPFLVLLCALIYSLSLCLSLCVSLQHGRPLIILANKMDLVGEEREEREKVNRFLTHAVPAYDGVTCIPVSAKTGLGMPFLLPAITEAYDKWCKRIQTSHLNEWLHDLKYVPLPTLSLSLPPPR